MERTIRPPFLGNEWSEDHRSSFSFLNAFHFCAADRCANICEKLFKWGTEKEQEKQKTEALGNRLPNQVINGLIY